MHRIRVGGDLMGLLAALGAILVCVVGFPQARGFLVASVIAGLVAAIAFRIWFSRRPSDVEPLSIVANENKVAGKPADRASESYDPMKTQELSDAFGVNQLRPSSAMF